MPDRPVLPLPSLAVVQMLLLAVLVVAGCYRPLAVQDAYFAPDAPADRGRVEAQHLVSHHRALQTAMRACPPAPAAALREETPSEAPGGPDGENDAAARAALVRLCAAVPPPPSVAAHGAVSSAYQRWVDDAVRPLPAASETAASAAGGS